MATTERRGRTVGTPCQPFGSIRSPARWNSLTRPFALSRSRPPVARRYLKRLLRWILTVSLATVVPTGRIAPRAAVAAAGVFEIAPRSQLGDPTRRQERRRRVPERARSRVRLGVAACHARRSAFGDREEVGNDGHASCGTSPGFPLIRGAGETPPASGAAGFAPRASRLTAIPSLVRGAATAPIAAAVANVPSAEACARPQASSAAGGTGEIAMMVGMGQIGGSRPPTRNRPARRGDPRMPRRFAGAHRNRTEVVVRGSRVRTRPGVVVSGWVNCNRRSRLVARRGDPPTMPEHAADRQRSERNERPAR